MAIDSIGLLAQQSYSQIQNRPKVESSNPSTGAVNFHQLVDKQFNSFAKMSPEQILSRIHGSRETNTTNSILTGNNAGGIAGRATGILREVVSKQENVARKSLIGEASLVELLTTTTEAKNVMDSTVKIRDKFLEAFDKVMNMSM
jgi:flagellar hook-basal body complex protein FliE